MIKKKTERSLFLHSTIKLLPIFLLLFLNFPFSEPVAAEAADIITTAAGNGTAGYCGDGGPATSACLDLPRGVAVDSLGNIYIADEDNHRIRKVDPDGIITTVAGNGTAGDEGDGGPATHASLNDPWGVFVDPWDNLYIADQKNHRVRKVDTSGTITTVAGNGTAGDEGDGGPATHASLKHPWGMSMDASGNLYIADMMNHRIRMVDTGGTITTVAGNGTDGYSGDGGPATSAELSFPTGVVVDASGNYYIADPGNHRIRKVDTGGIITTIAGNGIKGYSGDDGPATSASLDLPHGLTLDSFGNIYIADTGNNLIRKVDLTDTITTVAGNGTEGYCGDDGPAISACLYQVFGVAVDSSDNIYIADKGNNRIRKVTISDPACTDADTDTYFAESDCGTPVDCDDNDSNVYPDASEVCDNIDNNCDGATDENLTQETTCGVGACSGNTGTETCTAGVWGGDTCDPLAGATAEVCDNIDNDCDGSTDENLTQGTTCGVGACSGNTGTETCTAGTWGGDTCDPLAGATAEICDGIDNNCDDQIDEGCLTAITVTPDTVTLITAGATQQLTVTGYYAEGTTGDLTASSTGTTYSSDNPSAATVDTEGLVTAVADGTAIIIADNSGFTNTSTVTVSIGVVDIIPPQITISSPQHQEEIYASTVDVTGTVNEPVQSVIVNGTPATINNLAFTAAGISLDQCENTITIEAQDLAGNSSTKSIIVYNNTFAPEVTSESGYIVGYVLEYGTEIPIQGSRVTVEGICGSLLTDVNGRYVFPLQGFFNYSPIKYFNYKAEMQGYTHVNFQVQGMIGKEIPAEPTYLTPIDTQVTTITPALGGTAANVSGDTEVVFPVGAVSQDIDVSITMYDTEEQLPAPLLGRELYAIGQFEPEGAVFDVPVMVRLPNRYNLPAGVLVPCVDYDPLNKAWNDVGDGIVTADEQFIELEVQHFSWYGAIWISDIADDTPTSPVSEEIKDETCEQNGSDEEEHDCVNSAISLKQGTLKLGYSLASYKSMGKERSMNLVYNSSTAYPQAAVSFSTSSSRTPKYTKPSITAFGMRKNIYFNNDNGKFTWTTEAKDANGKYLESMIYPYSINLTNYYDITRYYRPTPDPNDWVPLTSAIEKGFSNVKVGSFVVNNKINSTFGSGWSLSEGAILKKDLASGFLVLEGNGDAHQFSPVDYWIDTVAGGGIGDGIQAPEASVVGPSGVTVDSSGNIYIADKGHYIIRKIDANGIITTVAGNGTRGFLGDSGPATEARLSLPEGVAVDSQGNIYIADVENHRIRMVDSGGEITTVAGDGNSGYSGDGGPAIEASLSRPEDVAVDSEGNILVADSANYRIRKIDNNGIITTVAGSGSSNFNGDGGPALSAGLEWISGVTVDGAGNIYITHTLRVRKVDTNGIITTIAGNGQWDSSGDGGSATDASMMYPDDVAVDFAGNIYIADSRGDRVRVVDTNGIINTAAGTGEKRFGGDGGLATEASLYWPEDVALDLQGNYYIADSYNHRIRKVDTSGVITTVVGKKPDESSGGFSGDGGPAINAALSYPEGVAVDSSGNIYISDKSNDRIRKVDTNGIITTIAGGGTSLDDGIPAVEALLNTPRRLTVDSAGNIYFPDFGPYRIRKIDINGIISTVAGNGTYGDVISGSIATNTPMRYPNTIDVDDSGNIYFSESYYDYGKVHKVDTNGIITTIAGNGTYGSSGDGGPAISASLMYPTGIAVDTDGNIFIADKASNKVRMVSSATGTIITVAGTGAEWYSGDGGPASMATLDTPKGLATDTAGNIYIADLDNHRIRILSRYLALRNSSEGIEMVSQNGESTLSYFADGTADLTFKNGSKKYFNAEGQQASTVDRNGNTTTYEYDTSGNLITITDPVGLVTTLSYGSGKLGSITTPDGRFTTFTHDGNGDLTYITEPDGSMTQYTYDSRHLATSKTRPNGEITQYNFDSNGRINNVIAPTGETINYVPADATGLINGLTGTKSAPATNIPTSPSTKTDGMGYSHAYKTDAQGATLEYTNPLGNLTQYERDDQSRPTRIVRADGTEVTMTYDPQGNLLSATNVTVGATTEMTYNQFSQVTSIADPLGNVTNMTYDTNGNLTDITDALGDQTSFTYDTNGLVTTTTDAQGNITSYTYDLNSNLASITDPLGNATTYTRDGAGNILTITDANGNITTYSYDSRNRIISVADAQGNTTTYVYAPSCGCSGGGGGDRLASATTANGNTTSFTYDEIGQLISETDPMGRVTTYTYDANRQLATRTDPNGDTITYTYDELNRLIQKLMPGDTVNFSYDTVGRLTSAGDTDSSLTFTYDTAGRLTDIVNSLGAVSYTYDLNGNRLTMTDAEGGATDYIYDTLNRLTDITNPNAETSTFTYDTLSRRTEALLPNGGTAAYTYDAASRLVDLVNEVNTSSVSGFGYTYDNIGNRLTMTDKDGLHNYGYDNIYRLLSATHPQPENPAEVFTYDPVGNRLSDSTYNDHLYNANNQLTSYDSVVYNYDNNGNTISKTDTTGTTYYTYDPENRLTRIDFPDATYGEYKYDPFGRRIQKNVNGTITQYLYDGEDILAEYDATNTRMARYTHGPGIDEPLIMERGGASYYYHKDGLGSVTEITDSTGSVVNEYVYNSFGKIVKETESVQNPYTYTARERDKESGLYFYRARYYDASIGRFISADPLGIAGGINLYSYTGNNPVNWIDPWGLVPRWMVPQFLIDNSQRAVNNITNNSFSETEIAKMTDLTIETIGLNPFATATLADALRLGTLDPDANPMVLTPEQAQSVEDVFKSLQEDKLSKADRELIERAREEWEKALETGRCVIK